MFWVSLLFTNHYIWWTVFKLVAHDCYLVYVMVIVLTTMFYCFVVNNILAPYDQGLLRKFEVFAYCWALLLMKSLIMSLRVSEGIQAARNLSTFMLEWTLCQLILLAELPVKLQ